MRRLFIDIEDCRDCPWYERMVGRERLYHTCRYSNRTTTGNWEVLMNYCDLEEVEVE